MCYNSCKRSTEVSILEQEKFGQEQLEQAEKALLEPDEGYQPRPAWQVWAARVGLAVFIVVLILYYLQIFRGGS